MDPPIALTLPALDAADEVRHAFFTRTGGVSSGLYESLNCGFSSNDEADNVRRNRTCAMAALGCTTDVLITSRQVHGTQVAVVEGPWPPGETPIADGLVTAVPGLALGLLTADCAPVFFVDGRSRIIGAAHAGWRGAIAGILESTVETMIGSGARATRIVAGIGACIGRESYEVGPSFPDPFLEEAADNDKFFRPAARDGHHMFDLSGYIRCRLESMELRDVTALDNDTCHEADLFFSYRRSRLHGEHDFGRGLSAILIQR